VVVGAYYLLDRGPGPASTAVAPQAPAASFDERFDGAMIESIGVVERLLPDDTDGARHQRFILRLGSGQTLLVAHNIDLAPRIVDLARGDTVKFRGRYERNERGGVVHWTHHDPSGETPGGWLGHEGRRYR
jgi:Protein of unknown function (DUF3465)